MYGRWRALRADIGTYGVLALRHSQRAKLEPFLAGRYLCGRCQPPQGGRHKLSLQFRVRGLALLLNANRVNDDRGPKVARAAAVYPADGI